MERKKEMYDILKEGTEFWGEKKLHGDTKLTDLKHQWESSVIV